MIRIPSPNIGLTKSYPLLFILSVRQLHRFHLPRNQSKTRRSIPVYLHFHIPGPDNDPSVYSQYPPLAGAILIGAITTHRMQYPDYKVYTTLAEGRIKVSTTKVSVVLNPDQQAVIEPNNDDIVTRDVPAYLFTSFVIRLCLKLLPNCHGGIM